MDMHLHDGTLFSFGYGPNVTIRENVLTQFFKDFTSVEDFFISAILASKGIEFEPTQQKFGVGNISLFAISDFGPYFTEFRNGFCVSLDSLQIGVNVAFPSASKSSGKKLWEIELGNSFGYKATFFTSLHFRTESNSLNPFFNLGIEINSKFCVSGNNGIRMPRVVKHDDPDLKLKDNTDILAPVFGEYLSDPFEEFDTTVAIFADKAVDATVKIGRRIFFGIGNFFHNVFQTRFRCGIFYNYSSKYCDSFYISDESFDSSLLSFKSKSHRMGWNLTYQSVRGVEVGFGSEHIFSGKNVPEQHEIFASFVVSF